MKGTKRFNMGRWSALAFTVGTISLLTACESTITKESVESGIRTQFEEQTKTKLEALDCPNDIKAKAGEAYECKGKASGVDLTIEVKPTGEAAKFTWQVTKQDLKVLPAAAVETEVKKGIETQTKVKVDSVECPDDMEPKQGSTYECKVQADGEAAVVEIVPTGQGAEYSWKLKKG